MPCICCDTHAISLCSNICRIYDYKVYISVYIIVVDLDWIDLTGKRIYYLKEKIEKIDNKIKLHLVREQAISRPWLMSCNAKIQNTSIDVTGTIPERLPNTQLPGMKTFDVVYK